MDAHPDPKIEYTAKLEKARINRMLRLISITGNGMGRGAHNVSDNISASIGVNRKRAGEEVEGYTGSLINSLIPSAIGCNNPKGPTMLGPFRSCIYPSIFRSIRVKKATAKRTGTIYINGLIMWVKSIWIIS